LESLRVTVVQVGRLGDGSFDSVKELVVRLAREAGVGDIVFLPENWMSGRPVDVGVFEKVVFELYELLGSSVAGGLQHVVDDDGFVRSVGLAVIEGSLIRVCEKLYPSKATGERGRVKPGRLVEPFSVKGWVVGCIACVDIFYPEVSRALVARGAHIIYNPASIPGNRVELWRSAVRIRGVENVVYSIGVNATGNVYPDGRVTMGGSVAYSPWGKMLLSLHDQPSASTVELNVERLREAVERWAFREDFERYYRRLYVEFQLPGGYLS
jgi:predicted amidohydrolase